MAKVRPPQPPKKPSKGPVARAAARGHVSLVDSSSCLTPPLGPPNAPASLCQHLPEARDNDSLLGAFLEYMEQRNLGLYPAQEAAILELFEEKNVILNTPTGSGKSLVATALHFKALAQGSQMTGAAP